jgi:hypothetical protein
VRKDREPGGTDTIDGPESPFAVALRAVRRAQVSAGAWLGKVAAATLTA